LYRHTIAFSIPNQELRKFQKKHSFAKTQGKRMQALLLLSLSLKNELNNGSQQLLPQKANHPKTTSEQQQFKLHDKQKHNIWRPCLLLEKTKLTNEAVRSNKLKHQIVCLFLGHVEAGNVGSACGFSSCLRNACSLR
jgi:hypothetical protein